MRDRIVAYLKRLWPVFRNGRVWLPIVGLVVTSLLAHGLIAPTGTVHDLAIVLLEVLGKLGIYGVAAAGVAGAVAAAAWQPPRKPLVEMTDAEREVVFKAHPEARASWEERQRLLATPPRPGDILDGGGK
jgi:hypothetical protein